MQCSFVQIKRNRLLIDETGNFRISRDDEKIEFQIQESRKEVQNNVQKEENKMKIDKWKMVNGLFLLSISIMIAPKQNHVAVFLLIMGILLMMWGIEK